MPYLKKDCFFTISSDSIENVKYKKYNSQEENVYIIKKATDKFIEQLQEIFTGTPFEELVTWDVEKRTFSLWNFDFLVEIAPCRVDCGRYTYSNNSNGGIYAIPYIKAMGWYSHYQSITQYLGYDTYCIDHNGRNSKNLHGWTERINQDYPIGANGVCPNIYGYSLIMVYNDNVLSLYYISADGINCPIITLIKGKTLNNKDVVYMASYINDNYRMNSGGATASEPIWNYCAIKFCDYPYDSDFKHTIPYMTNGYSYNQQCRDTMSNERYNSATLENTNDLNGIFTRVWGKRFMNSYERKLLNINSNVSSVIPAICCGGFISLENLYCVDEDFPTNVVVTMDNDDQFYCPHYDWSYKPNTDRVNNIFALKI